MPIIERKARPFHFAVSVEYAVARDVLKIDDKGKPESLIPGVAVNKDGLWCSRDTVEIVGRLLQIPIPPESILRLQNVTPSDWPGMANYDRIFPDKAWPHQPTGGAFLASRTAALQCDPARTGKNTSVLIAATLVDAKQTIIATNGTPKLGWAEDIVRWFGVSPLILEGRSAKEAWYLCEPCRGTGVVSPAGKPEPCPTCRTGRGRAHRGGWRHVTTSIPEALATAKFIVVNYDILIPHRESDEAGAVTLSDRMRGWLPEFRRHCKRYDTLVTDEIQKVGDKGIRRASLKELSRNVSRVWAPTATPTDGKLVKLWSPLDIITGGLFGRSRKRFASRYAEGYEGQYGFEVPKDGCSIYGKTELTERLAHLKIARTSAEIDPGMPEILRQVVRIDSSKAAQFALTSASTDAVEKVLNATAAVKAPTVIESVIDALEDGKKVVVYTRERAPGLSMYAQVARALTGKSGEDMRSRRSELWCSIGKTTDMRVSMADAFSRHDGAGAFFATIDGFQTGRSLLGVSFNFYADLHWSADAINQTERRSRLFGVRTNLVSVFFVVSGSPDEEVISVLLPKLETLEVVLKDEVAGQYRELFAPQETIDEIFARHAARNR